MSNIGALLGGVSGYYATTSLFGPKFSGLQGNVRNETSLQNLKDYVTNNITDKATTSKLAAQIAAVEGLITLGNSFAGKPNAASLYGLSGAPVNGFALNPLLDLFA